MPVDVQYAVAQDQLPLPEAPLREKIESWVAAVISAVGVPEGADERGGRDPGVCIRFVEKQESLQLNLQYRNKDKPTNVLSFPAEPLPMPDVEEMLGDIVICAGVVACEAREQSKPLLDHLAHMVIHGMLHLYGYDHERDAASMHEMETLEREILERFGVSDPYREI